MGKHERKERVYLIKLLQSPGGNQRIYFWKVWHRQNSNTSYFEAQMLITRYQGGNISDICKRLPVPSPKWTTSHGSAFSAIPVIKFSPAQHCNNKLWNSLNYSTSEYSKYPKDGWNLFVAVMMWNGLQYVATELVSTKIPWSAEKRSFALFEIDMTDVASTITTKQISSIAASLKYHMSVKLSKVVRRRVS